MKGGISRVEVWERQCDIYKVKNQSFSLYLDVHVHVILDQRQQGSSNLIQNILHITFVQFILSPSVITS